MSSSLFKDEKRTQYSPLMTREEQVRDRDDGRRSGWMTRTRRPRGDDDGRRGETRADARARCDGFERTEGGGAIDARTEARELASAMRELSTDE